MSRSFDRYVILTLEGISEPFETLQGAVDAVNGMVGPAAVAITTYALGTNGVAFREDAGRVVWTRTGDGEWPP